MLLYSKALSLPGERIGWVYVSDAADDGDAVAVAVAGAGRALGYVCAPVLLQRVAARCVGEPSGRGRLRGEPPSAD